MTISLRAPHGIPATSPVQLTREAVKWRRAQLLAIGLDEFTAHLLASDPTSDIHALVTEAEYFGESQLHVRKVR